MIDIAVIFRAGTQYNDREALLFGGKVRTAKETCQILYL